MYDGDMTATTTEQQAQGAAPDQGPDVPCDTRLATWIPAGIDERLRLFATLRRRPLGRTLADVLGGALPTVEDIGRELQQRGASGDDAH
jgi:hypothetical protein